MGFLFTSFLAVLAVIAIPVILHFFHFRRYKKVLFPSIHFLKDIVKTVQSQSKLRRLLVLFCRIMAVTFIVFAFAQPYIPSGKEMKQKSGNRLDAVYLDNSFSMEASIGGDKLFNAARKKIENLATSLRPSDKIFLTVNQFNPRQFRPVNRDDMIESLNDLRCGPIARTFSQVLVRQHEILAQAGDGQRSVYIFSDFQKSFWDAENIKPDSATMVHLVCLESGTEPNLFIDSCWFYSPVHQLNKPEKLFIRIRNTSGDDLENIPVKLYINSRQKSLTNFQISSDGTALAEVSFTISEPGVQHGVLMITDHPIEFDNTFYFSYSVLDTIRILAIGKDSANRYLSNVFQRNEFTSLENTTLHSLNYSSINSYHLVIIHDLEAVPSGLARALTDFIRQGGSLLVIPPLACDRESYSNLSDDPGILPVINSEDTVPGRIGYIDYEHELFSGVFDEIPENPDVPLVRYHYPVDIPMQSPALVIMKLENGDPILVQVPAAKGQIWFCTVPVNNHAGNFHRHALFVPVMLKIALLSQPVRRLYYTLGKDYIIPLSYGFISPDEPVHITGYSNSSASQPDPVDIIPEVSTTFSGTIMNIHDQIETAGNFNILSGQTIVQGISFNYDRAESDPECYSTDEIKEKLQNPLYRNFSVNERLGSLSASSDFGNNYGKPLWKICLLIALLFIGTEGLLLRFLK